MVLSWSRLSLVLESIDTESTRVHGLALCMRIIGRYGVTEVSNRFLRCIIQTKQLIEDTLRTVVEAR